MSQILTIQARFQCDPNLAQKNAKINISPCARHNLSLENSYPSNMSDSNYLPRSSESHIRPNHCDCFSCRVKQSTTNCGIKIPHLGCGQKWTHLTTAKLPILAEPRTRSADGGTACSHHIHTGRGGSRALCPLG